MNKTCKIEGYNKELYARGYCFAHYTKLWKEGKFVKKDGRNSDKKCKAPGCERIVYAKGYCMNHYEQVRRHGKVTN